MEKAIPTKSFIALVQLNTNNRLDIVSELNNKSENDFISIYSGDSSLQIAFKARNPNSNHTYERNKLKKLSLILGDSSEVADSKDIQCRGNSVVIDCHLNQNEVKFCTSIVSLPALFIYRDSDYIIITTDIYLLKELPFVYLKLNHKGIINLCSIGHMVDDQTLFKNVNLLPAGHLVHIINGTITINPFWQVPRIEPMDSMKDYIETQAENLRYAVHSIDWNDSFLSLTGGLDTRAILSLLLNENGIEKLPACTISGPNMSLDAIMAKTICANLGLKHQVISLDDNFLKNLPAYIQEACLLTGGLASLEQAHEVYFFSQVKDIANNRISGHLGNQIGRRGVEKISMRNVDRRVLNSDLTDRQKVKKNDYWGENDELGDGIPAFEFLLQKEVPYTSVGNYSIGNHFAVQQAPYAHNSLIETVFQMPSLPSSQKEISSLQMRIHDLRHRFLGQPASDSFQTKLIKEAGGFLAHYPINWGWRAKGGVSISGFMMGIASMGDAFLSSKSLYTSKAGGVLRLMNIEGLLNYINLDAWIKIYLKEFIYDTLFSKNILECGVFNNKFLRRSVDDYFSNKSSSTKEIVFAVDIALAIRLFKIFS